jgi:hypothetical protein
MESGVLLGHCGRPHGSYRHPGARPGTANAVMHDMNVCIMIRIQAEWDESQAAESVVTSFNHAALN